MQIFEANSCRTVGLLVFSWRKNLTKIWVDPFFEPFPAVLYQYSILPVFFAKPRGLDHVQQGLHCIGDVFVNFHYGAFSSPARNQLIFSFSCFAFPPCILFLLRSSSSRFFASFFYRLYMVSACLSLRGWHNACIRSHNLCLLFFALNLFPFFLL